VGVLAGLTAATVRTDLHRLIIALLTVYLVGRLILGQPLLPW
jgi:hypothetical protein